MLDRAKGAMKRYHTHAVIANLLQTRGQEAWLLYDLEDCGGNSNIEHYTVPDCSSTELEDTLTRRIANLHATFLASQR